MGRPLLGVLVLLGASLASPAADAQDAETDWPYEDPAGDTYFRDKESGVQGPPSALNAYADLTRIDLGQETDVDFEATFTFVDLKPYWGELTWAAGWITGGFDVLHLRFQVRGASIAYDLQTYLYHGDTSEAPGVGTLLGPSQLCLRAGEGKCYWQAAEPRIDYQANTITIKVPKLGLLGRLPTFDEEGEEKNRTHPEPPPGTPKLLDPGTTLERFRATYERYYAFSPTGWYDEAPNSGNMPTFVLQQPTANSRVAFITPQIPVVAVEAGTRTLVDVGVENRIGFKRILNLTHTLEGPPEAVSKIHVKLPPTVTLNRGASVNLAFVVDAEPGLRPHDVVNLTLRGQSLAYAEEWAHLKLQLAPSISPSVESPTLYFHGKRWSQDPTDIWCLLAACTDTWFNAYDEDPAADPEAQESGWPELDQGDPRLEIRIPMNPLSARPIAFDASKPLQTHLRFKSPVPVDLHATIRLSTKLMEVAHEEKEIHVDPAGSLVDFSLAPAAPSLVLPAGVDGRLTLEILLEASPTNPAGVAAITSNQIRFLTKDSSIALPLTQLPETLLQGSPLAPFTLRIPEELQEDYVNSGEARLFNVTILNRGDRVDTVHLMGTLDQASWKLELLPGNSFRLNPGESILVGVLVGAPGDAKEGSTAAIRLNATSDGWPDEPSFLRLTLTVTNQVPLSDDAGLFHADPDTEEKLLGDSGPRHNTPGFGAPLVALTVLLFLRRRVFK